MHCQSQADLLHCGRAFPSHFPPHEWHNWPPQPWSPSFLPLSSTHPAMWSTFTVSPALVSLSYCDQLVIFYSSCMVMNYVVTISNQMIGVLLLWMWFTTAFDKSTGWNFCNHYRNDLVLGLGPIYWSRLPFLFIFIFLCKYCNFCKGVFFRALCPLLLCSLFSHNILQKKKKFSIVCSLQLTNR